MGKRHWWYGMCLKPHVQNQATGATYQRLVVFATHMLAHLCTCMHAHMHAQMRSSVYAQTETSFYPSIVQP